MPILANIQKYGNQLVAVFDDGSRVLAYPTPNGNIWLSGTGKTEPEPDPDPTPGGRFMWPFNPSTDVTSEYGYRPQYGRVHQGIDFGKGAATLGAEIKCAGDGRVFRQGWHNNFGNHLVIDHGSQLYTLYAHMNAPARVRVGNTVKKGQIVGNVGNTGRSYGAHLHWETHVGGLRWTNPGTHKNPRDFMKKYA